MIQIDTIISLVHETKSIITDSSLRFNITEKGLADFVTEVDTNVQHFLQNKLYELYPEVQFMGEEDHMRNVDPQKPFWILDPIDGTTNLIYDYKQSAVSLAYCENGEILAGVVYNPFSEETFWAVKNKGAYLNGQPIHATKKAALKDSLVSIGTTPYKKSMAKENFILFQTIFEKSLDIRRSGSAALDLAYVACGRVDAYFEKDLKPWDYAAGSLLVTEAGGSFTLFNGMPIDFTKNQDIISSNGLIHEELTSILCNK